MANLERSMSTSQIGNYIHLHKQNYIKHGIAHINGYGVHESARSSATKAVANARRKAQKLHSKNLDKSAFTSILTRIFRSENIINSATLDALIAPIRQQIEDLIREDFNTAQKDIIDFSTGKANRKKIKSTKNISYLKGTEYMQVESVVKRIDALQKAAIERVSLGEMATAQNIWSILKTMAPLITYFQNEILNNQVSVFGKRAVKLEMDKMSSLQDLLNLGLEISKLSSAANLMQGVGFQYAIAATLGIMDGIAISNIATTMKKSARMPRTKTVMNIETANPVLKSELDSLFEEHKEIYGDIYVSTRPSPQKVDVSYVINGERQNVSAKNYNLSTEKGWEWIHIVSQSNLLYLMQDETNLLNHLLNILAHDLRGYKDGASLVFTAAKTVCLLQAMAGTNIANENRNQANLFIVNDNRKGGKIYVYDMADIFERVLSHIGSVRMSVNGDKSGLDSVSLAHANEKQPIVSTRLAKVIFECYKLKISMAIPKTIIE